MRIRRASSGARPPPSTASVDYFAIKHALESGHGYAGTVEFFPEEGKYHLDGHRKCEVRLSPKETLAHGGLCPVCGQPLTIGVEHRVEVLADRSEAQAAPPPTAGAVSSLVPLPEILSELTATGAASHAVARSYDHAIAKLGPELSILQSVPVEDIAHAGSAILAEAITRLRTGHVIRDAGYDGEYGVIRLFEENELKRLTSGALLFDAPMSKRKPAEAVRPAAPSPAAQEDAPVKPARPLLRIVSDRTSTTASGILAQLDEDQRAAAGIVDGPLLIVAGPGSGKTRTLTYRIAHLVAERGAAAENCLAITFTRRAAAEMRERLSRLLPTSTGKVAIHTFHSLGLAILREHASAAGLDHGFRVAGEAERIELLAATLELSAHKAERLLRGISREKRTQSWAGAEVTEARAAYARAMALRNWIDFDDLVALSVRVLVSDARITELYRSRLRWISVDEFQDVDEQQYRLLTLLAPPDGNLCAIGDPNQAIYGFRGADASCFDRFRQDYPETRIVRLARNYRSTGTIVTASSQVIAPRPNEPVAEIVRDMHERIAIHTAPTERAEAESVVKTIEHMIGGHSFFSIDSGRAAVGPQASRSFADFAVLYRTDGQSASLREALDRSGIPYQRHSHTTLAEEPAVRTLLQELGDGSDATTLADDLRAAGNRLAERGDAGASATIAMALQRLIALAERLRQRSRALRRRRRAHDGIGILGCARRPRVAADLACRQGSRVCRRVHRRARGRPAAAALGRAGRRGDGGRASTVLCRHDPSQGPADPQPRAPAPLARPHAHAGTIAVPARHRKRAGEAPAHAGRARQTRRPAAQAVLAAGSEFFVVIAGLEPAIHLVRKSCLRRMMDRPEIGFTRFRYFKCASRINPTCVVKPAGDARE